MQPDERLLRGITRRVVTARYPEGRPDNWFPVTREERLETGGITCPDAREVIPVRRVRPIRLWRRIHRAWHPRYEFHDHQS